MKKKHLKPKWTKEEFDQARVKLYGGSTGIAFLVALGYAFILLCFDLTFLFFSCFFVFALAFTIAQKKRFFQWKNELIEDGQLSRQEFSWLSKKYESEEYSFFNNKSLALWCIFGLLMYGGCFYYRIRQIELHDNSLTTVGKVVEIDAMKTTNAVVEFYVSGARYEARKPIYRNDLGRYSYSPDSDTPFVWVGDKLKVKFYEGDPNNNEVIGARPIKP